MGDRLEFVCGDMLDVTGTTSARRRGNATNANSARRQHTSSPFDLAHAGGDIPANIDCTRMRLRRGVGPFLKSLHTECQIFEYASRPELSSDLVVNINSF